MREESGVKGVKVCEGRVECEGEGEILTCR